MAQLELRDVLELAREFRCRRLKFGNIEVELALEPQALPPEPPRLPTEAEVRLEMQTPRTIPEAYRQLMKGAPPTFADIQGTKK